MRNGYIYVVVSVSGASVLALEILGTRILGPFYGVSLFLWSALITVTLAALSLGYAIGGRWADAGPKLKRLSLLLVLAGIWVTLIPWLKRPVLVVAEPFGLRLAVLVAAAILFFPPLALLGMVSPYAIRLKASGIEVVGRTAGNLYAVSTVASVAAALLVGFFLIPSVGVTRITLGTGFLLVGTAIYGVTSNWKNKAVLFVLVLAAGAIAVLTLSASGDKASAEAEEVLAMEQSVYGEIRVVESEGARCLLIDGGIHTEVDAETGESMFPYVDVLDIVKLFYDKPGRMVLVGLGGGSVVKRFAGEGWRVDAVEIDPVVTRIAREHFGLEDKEAVVHHMDGRRFFGTTDETFDVVIMDAFGSSSIPFHLVTRESFALIRSRLVPKGILAVNVEATAWDDILVQSLGATMQRVFEHVVVLPMAEPPNTLGNLVLLASDRPLELVNEPPVPMDRFSREYNRAHAWDNRFEVDPEGVPILTDDHNPVDVWSEHVNVASRRWLHEQFDPQVSW
jgi:spermidine synthase